MKHSQVARRVGNVIYVTFGEKQSFELFTQAHAIDDTNPVEGIKLYKKCIGLNPNHAAAWSNMGNVHFRRGEKAEAGRCWKKALEIDPEHPEANYNTGYKLICADKLKDALPYMLKCLKSRPYFTEAHFYVAYISEDMKDFVTARKHWLMVVKTGNESNEHVQAAKKKLEGIGGKS